MNAATPTTTIPVGTSYDVVIGHDLADHLPIMLGEGVQRVALLYAGELGNLAEPVIDVLVEHYEVLALGLPDGEEAKTAAVANECWEALGEKGFTRSDAVVTFGGGATTDLGGFVAASWLRGVKVVHVPTTLLAMVDAAVGGKTGINTGAGKNLVGAFHEPAGVLCDLSLLATLPADELTAGMGEVVKCGFIADPEILAIVEAASGPITADSPQLAELVERAVRVKAEIVAADLKETGGAATLGAGHPGREALNYGHTLGHAIEKNSGYQMRHGEAVAIGCIYVAEIAARSGLIDADLLARHRTAFATAGLPTTYPWGDYSATFDELIGAMRVDKKARGSLLRFLVLHGLAKPAILAGPDEQILRDAFDALAPAAV
ncbi:3-dehydroquinate synthase [Nocardioides nematodiphilus]|uniref:3-dehydroquinate synthase n=1 Tax=Nocardioides nematodiphilus TaxID=2849669 RepID=UPI001CDA3956|nr:3-dehydroquinate synthase [Nocardioides nematodiphilus]MCA1982762.1 3-dehydroquinate synthase [Nocardioides nematodiphilus]